MVSAIRPALDPLAQRAAIDALEAQRAAYRRYARTVDEQAHAVSAGDGNRAAAAADAAACGFDELEDGARRLRPHLERVRAEGSPDQRAEVQSRIETLAREAERAQVSIQNLTAQLDAWRVAYGRQLASTGLTPGGTGQGRATVTDVGAVGTVAALGEPGRPDVRGADPRRQHSRGYGPRGQVAPVSSAPKLLNRLG